MSKRAEEAALNAYPKEIRDKNGIVIDIGHPQWIRDYYIEGYEQAEKDTIERAMEWIKTHWREYIIGPDADGCICFGHWENDFRKAMEEE